MDLQWRRKAGEKGKSVTFSSDFQKKANGEINLVSNDSQFRKKVPHQSERLSKSY
ncbi:hypothetical protein [Leptospira kanakyensis]|uniref:hypothetical protein n=1 Tax=Leptospira kanakyensis TaxID=2484968 RepID=UPI00142E6E7E|nr:hypothetical protein [Leptospira kanakyensis]